MYRIPDRKLNFYAQDFLKDPPEGEYDSEWHKNFLIQEMAKELIQLRQEQMSLKKELETAQGYIITPPPPGYSTIHIKQAERALKIATSDYHRWDTMVYEFMLALGLDPEGEQNEQP